MMLRAKRITPAGWMRVSSERRGGDISVPSKPMMRSWPICLWRSEVILVAIRDRARFLKKYLAPLGSCLVFRLPTACAVGCILVPLSRLLTPTNRTRTGGYSRTSLHLPLQFRQQIQRLERSQAVQIHLTQFFQHRL